MKEEDNKINKRTRNKRFLMEEWNHFTQLKNEGHVGKSNFFWAICNYCKKKYDESLLSITLNPNNINNNKIIKSPEKIIGRKEKMRKHLEKCDNFSGFLTIKYKEIPEWIPKITNSNIFKENNNDKIINKSNKYINKRKPIMDEWYFFIRTEKKENSAYHYAKCKFCVEQYIKNKKEGLEAIEPIEIVGRKLTMQSHLTRCEYFQNSLRKNVINCNERMILDTMENNNKDNNNNNNNSDIVDNDTINNELKENISKRKKIKIVTTPLSVLLPLVPNYKNIDDNNYIHMNYNDDNINNGFINQTESNEILNYIINHKLPFDYYENEMNSKMLLLLSKTKKNIHEIANSIVFRKILSENATKINNDNNKRILDMINKKNDLGSTMSIGFFLNQIDITIKMLRTSSKLFYSSIYDFEDKIQEILQKTIFHLYNCKAVVISHSNKHIQNVLFHLKEKKSNIIVLPCIAMELNQIAISFLETPNTKRILIQSLEIGRRLKFEDKYNNNSSQFLLEGISENWLTIYEYLFNLKTYLDTVTLNDRFIILEKIDRLFLEELEIIIDVLEVLTNANIQIKSPFFSIGHVLNIYLSLYSISEKKKMNKMISILETLWENNSYNNNIYLYILSNAFHPQLKLKNISMDHQININKSNIYSLNNEKYFLNWKDISKIASYYYYLFFNEKPSNYFEETVYQYGHELNECFQKEFLERFTSLYDYFTFLETYNNNNNILDTSYKELAKLMLYLLPIIPYNRTCSDYLNHFNFIHNTNYSNDEIKYIEIIQNHYNNDTFLYNSLSFNKNIDLILCKWRSFTPKNEYIIIKTINNYNIILENNPNIHFKPMLLKDLILRDFIQI